MKKTPGVRYFEVNFTSKLNFFECIAKGPIIVKYKHIRLNKFFLFPHFWELTSSITLSCQYITTDNTPHGFYNILQYDVI